MKNYKSSVSLIALCAFLSVPAYAGLFGKGKPHAEDIEPVSQVKIIDETVDAVVQEAESQVVPIAIEESVSPVIGGSLNKADIIKQSNDVVSDAAKLVESSERKVEEIQELVSNVPSISADSDVEFLAPVSQLQKNDDVVELVNDVEAVKTSAEILESTSFNAPKPVKTQQPLAEDRAEAMKRELLNDLQEAENTRKILLGEGAILEREVKEIVVTKPETIEEEVVDLSPASSIAQEAVEEVAQQEIEEVVPALTAQERFEQDKRDKSEALISRIIAEGKARKARKRQEEIERQEREAKKQAAKKKSAAILRAPHWSNTPSQEKAKNLFSKLEEQKLKPVEVETANVEEVDELLAKADALLKEDVFEEAQQVEHAKQVNVKSLYQVTKVDSLNDSLPELSDDVVVKKPKDPGISLLSQTGDIFEGKQDSLLNSGSLYVLSDSADKVAKLKREEKPQDPLASAVSALTDSVSLDANQKDETLFAPGVPVMDVAEPFEAVEVGKEGLILKSLQQELELAKEQIAALKAGTVAQEESVIAVDKVEEAVPEKSVETVDFSKNASPNIDPDKAGLVSGVSTNEETNKRVIPAGGYELPRYYDIAIASSGLNLSASLPKVNSLVEEKAQIEKVVEVEEVVETIVVSDVEPVTVEKAISAKQPVRLAPVIHSKAVGQAPSFDQIVSAIQPEEEVVAQNAPQSILDVPVERELVAAPIASQLQFNDPNKQYVQPIIKAQPVAPAEPPAEIIVYEQKPAPVAQPITQPQVIAQPVPQQIIVRQPVLQQPPVQYYYHPQVQPVQVLPNGVVALTPQQQVALVNPVIQQGNRLPDYRRPVRRRATSSFVSRSSVEALKERRAKTAEELASISFNGKPVSSQKSKTVTPATQGQEVNPGFEPFSR